MDKEKILYLKDACLKEIETEVKSVNGKYVVLGKTIFYATGGGQPCDTGKIIRIKDNKEFNVVFVGVFNNEVSHEVDLDELQKGDKVKCILNWERRYIFMKYHTAMHLLISIINKHSGALITGNQIGEDKSRLDLNLENFSKEDFIKWIDEANEIIKKDAMVKNYFISKEDAMKNPSLFKLKDKLPKDLEEYRITEVEGVDIQADGGTHVNSLKEIGRLEFLKAENKGKNNRRVYFRVV
ncbi:alanyl-tRNA editing protein [Candidatus Woesearchaeota archaeon]|nr:alanyl-tRNA editing protein [Candidatus Woesearchaeota archaeon]